MFCCLHWIEIGELRFSSRRRAVLRAFRPLKSRNCGMSETSSDAAALKDTLFKMEHWVWFPLGWYWRHENTTLLPVVMHVCVFLTPTWPVQAFFDFSCQFGHCFVIGQCFSTGKRNESLVKKQYNLFCILLRLCLSKNWSYLPSSRNVCSDNTIVSDSWLRKDLFP